MENTEVQITLKSDPPILSRREVVVDLRAKLDTMFAKLHLASQQLINGAQNLRESKLLLDACLEGKSVDDAPDEVEAFYDAAVELDMHVERMAGMATQFEVASEQVAIGAKVFK